MRLVRNFSGESAVLTHRLGEVSLDNALALTEGHSAPRTLPANPALSYHADTHDSRIES